MERKTKFDILRLLIVGSGLETDEKKELVDFVTDYEKEEENGLLKHLPCKAGSKVYEIVDDCNFGADCYTRRMCNGCEYRDLHIEPLILVSEYDVVLRMKEFGKTVFLTESEAEQALAKMKGV